MGCLNLLGSDSHLLMKETFRGRLFVKVIVGLPQALYDVSTLYTFLCVIPVILQLDTVDKRKKTQKSRKTVYHIFGDPSKK